MHVGRVVQWGERRCRYLALDNFSPGELLDKLCNETFKYHANVVLYLEFQNDNPSSTEYLLQVINFLGIPVMAWIGESSSLVKVSSERLLINWVYLTCLVVKAKKFSASGLFEHCKVCRVHITRPCW